MSYNHGDLHCLHAVASDSATRSTIRHVVLRRLDREFSSSRACITPAASSSWDDPTFGDLRPGIFEISPLLIAVVVLATFRP